MNPSSYHHASTPSTAPNTFSNAQQLAVTAAAAVNHRASTISRGSSNGSGSGGGALGTSTGAGKTVYNSQQGGFAASSTARGQNAKEWGKDELLARRREYLGSAQRIATAGGLSIELLLERPATTPALETASLPTHGAQIAKYGAKMKVPVGTTPADYLRVFKNWASWTSAQGNDVATFPISGGLVAFFIVDAVPKLAERLKTIFILEQYRAATTPVFQQYSREALLRMDAAGEHPGQIRYWNDEQWAGWQGLVNAAGEELKGWKSLVELAAVPAPSSTYVYPAAQNPSLAASSSTYRPMPSTLVPASTAPHYPSHYQHQRQHPSAAHPPSSAAVPRTLVPPSAAILPPAQHFPPHQPQQTHIFSPYHPPSTSRLASQPSISRRASQPQPPQQTTSVPPSYPSVLQPPPSSQPLVYTPPVRPATAPVQRQQQQQQLATALATLAPRPPLSEKARGKQRAVEQEVSSSSTSTSGIRAAAQAYLARTADSVGAGASRTELTLDQAHRLHVQKQRQAYYLQEVAAVQAARAAGAIRGSSVEKKRGRPKKVQQEEEDVQLPPEEEAEDRAFFAAVAELQIALTENIEAKAKMAIRAVQPVQRPATLDPTTTYGDYIPTLAVVPPSAPLLAVHRPAKDPLNCLLPLLPPPLRPARLLATATPYPRPFEPSLAFTLHPAHFRSWPSSLMAIPSAEQTSLLDLAGRIEAEVTVNLVKARDGRVFGSEQEKRAALKRQLVFEAREAIMNSNLPDLPVVSEPAMALNARKRTAELLALHTVKEAAAAKATDGAEKGGAGAAKKAQISSATPARPSPSLPADVQLPVMASAPPTARVSNASRKSPASAGPSRPPRPSLPASINSAPAVPRSRSNSNPGMHRRTSLGGTNGDVHPLARIYAKVPEELKTMVRAKAASIKGVPSDGMARELAMATSRLSASPSMNGKQLRPHSNGGSPLVESSALLASGSQDGSGGRGAAHLRRSLPSSTAQPPRPASPPLVPIPAASRVNATGGRGESGEAGGDGDGGGASEDVEMADVETIKRAEPVLPTGSTALGVIVEDEPGASESVSPTEPSPAQPSPAVPSPVAPSPAAPSPAVPSAVAPTPVVAASSTATTGVSTPPVPSPVTTFTAVASPTVPSPVVPSPAESISAPATPLAAARAAIHSTSSLEPIPSVEAAPPVETATPAAETPAAPPPPSPSPSRTTTLSSVFTSAAKSIAAAAKAGLASFGSSPSSRPPTPEQSMMSTLPAPASAPAAAAASPSPAPSTVSRQALPPTPPQPVPAPIPSTSTSSTPSAPTSAASASTPVVTVKRAPRTCAICKSDKCPGRGGQQWCKKYKGSPLGLGSAKEREKAKGKEEECEAGSPIANPPAASSASAPAVVPQKRPPPAPSTAAAVLPSTIKKVTGVSPFKGVPKAWLRVSEPVKPFSMPAAKRRKVQKRV